MKEHKSPLPTSGGSSVSEQTMGAKIYRYRRSVLRQPTRGWLQFQAFFLKKTMY